MLTKLYLYLLHWLEQSLPSPDDTHVKCATCGWESEHINNLKFNLDEEKSIESAKTRTVIIHSNEE